jgi:hypothetical protein
MYFRKEVFLVFFHNGMLRAILNFTAGPSLLGVNLAPRGEICSPGEMFTPLFTPRGEHSLLFRRMEGEREPRISLPRDNFTQGDKSHPWGTTSLLGSKFAPRGEVKNGLLFISVYTLGPMTNTNCISPNPFKKLPDL